MNWIGRFRTVTPVWIHWWIWNDAQSLMWYRRGVILFFKVIHQISRSHRLKNQRFEMVKLCVFFSRLLISPIIASTNDLCIVKCCGWLYQNAIKTLFILSYLILSYMLNSVQIYKGAQQCCLDVLKTCSYDVIFTVIFMNTWHEPLFLCRRCSNYIFILDSTSGFKGFGKGSRKSVRESFKCWDLVPLILKTWR